MSCILDNMSDIYSETDPIDTDAETYSDSDSDSETSAENNNNNCGLEQADIETILEDACTLADDYIRENVGKMSNPEFHDVLESYIFDQIRIVLFAALGESVSIDSNEMRDCMTKITRDAIESVCGDMHLVDNARFPPWRSEPHHTNGLYTSTDEHDRFRRRITELQGMQDQTQQRTPAWYERRHNMITASAAWKAFGTDAVINQLIYEKCKPFLECGDVQPVQAVNVDSPLHWGQKYEQLSSAIYQLKNNTLLGEFGCIQHSNPGLLFLGGSPDGINVDDGSPLYARMVEIKNIVNRDITGIPKEEYWIQMQLQMEVCDLDSCDFVETRFKEYDNVEDYEQDVEMDYQYRTDDRRSGTEFDIDDDDLMRGIIIYFIEKDTRKPHYEYMPIHYRDLDTQDAWVVNTIFEREQSGGYSWIRNIYWKLDQYSCVLVKRNRLWFTTYAALQLERVWRIIENERVTGYAHRAPRKRAATTTNRNGDSADGYTQTRLCRINL